MFRLRPADLELADSAYLIADLLVDRQLSPVETVGQDLGDRVPGKRVGATVARGAVTGLGQGASDLAVRLALRGQSKR